MIELIRSVYVTYRGDKENHRWRIVAMFIASGVLSVAATNLTSAVFPSMALAITVLAGFSFTALFSSHAIVVHDLPEIRDEEDRRDIIRLTKLANNFKVRSRFFLILAVVDLLLIIWLSARIDGSSFGEFLGLMFDDYSGGTRRVPRMLLNLNLLAFTGLKFIGVFIFLEAVYTFYRLAQTIMAVLDVRSEYFASRFDLND